MFPLHKAEQSLLSSNPFLGLLLRPVGYQGDFLFPKVAQGKVGVQVLDPGGHRHRSIRSRQNSQERLFPILIFERS